MGDALSSPGLALCSLGHALSVSFTFCILRKKVSLSPKISVFALMTVNMHTLSTSS